MCHVLSVTENFKVNLTLIALDDVSMIRVRAAYKLQLVEGGSWPRLGLVTGSVGRYWDQL